MDLKAHWQTIYTSKKPDEVSWYQENPALSLKLVRESAPDRSCNIIDVGGGASTLVDHLLTDGFRRITVLDISSEALQKSKARLGDRAGGVSWIEGNITSVILPRHTYDVWHDRAVFHFLTAVEDRQKYLSVMNEALKPGGSAIIATFALAGPQRCSGLDVVRYSPETLQVEFSPSFQMIDHLEETHRTPFATEQKFTYCLFRKVG